MTSNSPWKRNVATLLIGQSITLFGSMLVHYAVQWHITLTAQSGVAMMLLSISAAVPMFLISPFAGVWADRYSKKMLINLADAIIAVITLVMAVLFSLGMEYIALLMICTAVRGAGQGVQGPAIASLIPEVVPAEHLVRINGINSTIQSVTMFAAPIAGGALITFMPIQTVLYIDVITAAIGISMLYFFVKTPAKEKKAAPDTAWREMAEGITYIRGHAFVKKLLLMQVLFGLLITPAAALTPLHTVRFFAAEAWLLVAIELAFFIGMAVGGAVLGAWGGFKNKIYTVMAATVLFGIGAIGLGVSGVLPVYLGFMFLAGVAVPAINAPIMSIMQVKVDPEYMGRVFAVLMMLSSITMPVGMAVWGPLADIVDIAWLLIVSGAGIMALSVMFIYNKTLREAGMPVENPTSSL
jgi:DHA3 family macrolide efflux protein-like MFS transporter